MSQFSINQYHSEVEKIIHFGGTKKETAIRSAFYNLLNEYAKAKGLMIVLEVTIKATNGKNVTPDGTLKDTLRQDWGYWESKDEADNIDDEIKKKFDKGYPKENILFEDSQTAVLYQNGNEEMRVSMKDPEALDLIINTFMKFERPEIQNFRKAIEHFKEDIPSVTGSLRDLIAKEEKTNSKFKTESKKFLKLCHDSINPDVTMEDVREMIIQHILTEDIFNSVFGETQFHRENNIAHQLERVINTFFTGTIKRTALGTVKHYYEAINAAAAGIADHHEKQKFLKVVYETFYKSYNPKAADKLGVVYTPNEVVRFMVASTDYLLHKHFGKLLQDKGVEILDPATGTGTFICDIIDYIRKDKLEYKYMEEMHANEVAILPYYISNLNIEFTYKQKMGQYKEFQNLCFVDTLDNMGFGFAGKQLDIFSALTEENSKRINKQNGRKISVVIGNPPYNANQMNENDNNKNREYAEIDKRIKESFIKFSTAQKTKVYDMYARFYRWAFDRLDANGIIAFVTNRSFIDSRTFDGFRKCVQDNFEHAYIVDTKSDVRANPKISGTGHNIFGIQTGVAIMFLIHKAKPTTKGRPAKTNCNIQYFTLDDFWRREEKLQWFNENEIKEIPFDHVTPDKNNNWINIADNDFENLIPVCSKDVKSGKSKKALFELFSLGIATNRDEWVYDYDEKNLTKKIDFFSEVFNKESDRWKKSKQDVEINNFVSRTIKWTDELQSLLNKNVNLGLNKLHIRTTSFRPFVIKNCLYSETFIHRFYRQRDTFPIKSEWQNKVIAFSCISSDNPLSVLASNKVIDLGYLKSGNGGTFSISFYSFDELGNRIDNVSDWGLAQFCKRYKAKPRKEANVNIAEKTPISNDNLLTPQNDYAQPHLKRNEEQLLHEPISNYGKFISKEDIFHYTYAVLHNPTYRSKYALNLKREFPRIPFYDDFFKWAAWGKTLMSLHINYEKAALYPLVEVNKGIVDAPKAKLKALHAAGSIVIDENTQLTNVPSEAWTYKLGNRSALEWILDQYKESKPKDPTIADNFNTYHFSDYKVQVIELLKRVCTVSVETMKIVDEMQSTN